MYAACSTTARRGALDWAPKFEEANRPVFEAVSQILYNYGPSNWACSSTSPSAMEPRPAALSSIIAGKHTARTSSASSKKLTTKRFGALVRHTLILIKRCLVSKLPMQVTPLGHCVLITRGRHRKSKRRQKIIPRYKMNSGLRYPLYIISLLPNEFTVDIDGVVRSL